MSKVCDNWERLVAATLKRENFRELAHASSMSSSFSFSCTGCSFSFTFSHNSYGWGKMKIARLINLANMLMDVAGATVSKLKPKHRRLALLLLKLKSKAEQLSSLLQEVRIVSNILYDRPTTLVLDNTGQILNKAEELINRDKKTYSIGLADFQEVLSQLELPIGNISWLLQGGEYLNVPPLATDEPSLCHLWELIAILRTGTPEPDDKCDAAASLASLAREEYAYRKLIIEEGGVQALIRLLKEGNLEAKENSISLIRMLVKHDPGQKLSKVWVVKLLRKDLSTLCHILELISVLDKANDDPGNAVATLVSLALEDDVYRSFIIEEGGVHALMRIIGKPEATKWKESARRAIGLLAKTLGDIEQWFGVLDVR